MHGPATAGWLLVALCAASGGLCLLRTRSAAAEQRGSAGDEALMGFGMAAMAVPAAVLAPPRWVWLVYVVVFGGAALHALLPARGRWGRRHPHPHRSHHLLGTLAMVYMAGAMATAPSGGHSSHAGGGAGGAPLVTGALLFYFTGYVLWAGSRLVPLPAQAGARGGGDTATTAAMAAVAPLPARAAREPGVPRPAGVAGWGDRPELAFACRLSMGLAMLAMLLTV
ncbi:DUF5134 domain-containing protein [Streptomyces sp. NPDC088258]|uniref:DUF5134 domain-containing protein n=1 Tax=Streptomyces sp. NPDC088258 TaxID=3365849 RepID=UPI003822E58D